MRRNIGHAASFFCVLFAAIGVNLSYWQIFASEQLLNHPRNRRLVLNEKRVLRGGVFDRNGNRLVWSEFVRDRKTGIRAQVRRYWEPNVFCHLVGYLSDRYGRTGIEARRNSQLSGMTRMQTWDDVRDFLLDREQRGYDVFLTIDSQAQTAAVAALAGRRGAVVAIDPASGAILASVSNPGFDPAAIDRQWDALNANPDKPLFDRALFGLYPPGSTFKVVTAGDALEEAILTPGSRFVCNGHVNIHGYDVSCPNGKAHGALDFTQALVASCNVVFSQVAVEVGRDRYLSYANRWGLGEQLLFDLPSRPSSLVRRPENLSTTILAQTGFGQGEVVVTPLQMAVITATTANGGLRMRPYLVQRVSSYGGEVIELEAPVPALQVISPDTARTLAGMMQAVVRTGTTRRVFDDLPYAVAGKTGTAQNPHGEPHAWFIAFAPVESPRIAVACVIENIGTGARFAAPVVRKVIEAALSPSVARESIGHL